MSKRNTNNSAEWRAERIKQRVRPHARSQASRTMDERLRQLDAKALSLEERLRNHAKEHEAWHGKWDDLPSPHHPT